MLKKTISFIDFNGVSRTQEFLFNMTQAELLKMDAFTDGGMEQLIRNIVNEQDVRRIVGFLEDIALRSYGKKSPDGQRFIKSENGRPLSEEFAQTAAYSELFVELISVPDAAAAFITGVIPQALAEEIALHPQLTVVPD